jgi:hypothetical protein
MVDLTSALLGRKKKFHELLAEQSMSTAPTPSWGAALARALQGGIAGYGRSMADQEERAQIADANDSLVKAWGVPQQESPAPQSVGGALQGSGDPASAIASIESGGKYDKLGPVIKQGHQLAGDRAYGKYGVMGANVGPWTEKYVGQRMTPEQFVQSPEAQEAVFKGEFGRLSKAYGPEGASRAWFAGEGGMNKPNRSDQLGTTVSGYGQKFSKALGPQVASLGNGMPASDTPAPQPAGPQMAQGNTVNRGAVIQMLRNPLTRGGASAIIQQDIARRMKPPEYKIEITPGGEALAVNTADPTKTQRTTIPGAGAAAIQHSATKGAAEKVAERQATEGLPATSEETTSLRKEVQNLPSYKNITASAPVYKSMLDAAGRDNRAADVNLIYGMAKIMDPGSVVRESEMTIAQAVATLPQSLQATVLSQLKETGRLTPEVRAAIMGEAHGRMQQYQYMYDQDASMTRGIAERRRMDPRDVLQTFGPFEQFKPPAAALPPPQKTGQAPVVPQGVDKKVWDVMTPEERALWK